MQSPEQPNKRPKRGKKPFHRKDSSKQNQQHTNGKRQVFTKSSNYSPTQVQHRTPSNQAIPPPQSSTSQPKFQKGSKTKAGRGTPAGKPLQAPPANNPPIKTCRLCRLPCPLSHIEANHRHLLDELSDWFKQHNLTKLVPTPPTSPTTYRYVAPTSRLPINQRRNHRELSPQRNHRFFPRDNLTSPHSHQLPKNYHQTTRSTTMPATTIANACVLGPDMPIRPRNPYPRGTPRYTKRQNINRNVRLHLRNDRKTLQHDDLINKLVHDTHFSFYHALSNFDQWRHTRQLLPHDRTLIRE